MDRIYIEGLALRCVVGVFPEERREVQEVLIGIVLDTDLAAAGASDDLTDTIDYGELKRRIRSFVEQSRFHLIEALAEGVAAICLEEPRVSAARVRVDKPGALRFARTVAVEIERSR